MQISTDYDDNFYRQTPSTRVTEQAPVEMFEDQQQQTPRETEVRTQGLLQRLLNKKKNDKDVLNHQQINFAQKLIQEMHPLKNAHITRVWPFLKIFSKCFKCAKPKRDFRTALKHNLLKKMDLPISQNELDLEKDPFLKLGFGMQAYFDLISEFAQITAVLTVVFFPVMLIYNSHSFYDGKSMGTLNSFMLGNFGAGTTACNQVSQAVENAQLVMSCPSGKLNPWEMQAQNPSEKVLQIGIIPSKSDANNYCSNQAFEDPYNCSQYLNIEAITSVLESQAAGKEAYAMVGFDSDQYRLPTPNDDVQNMCFGRSSLVFMQVACTFADDDLTLRKKQGLTVGAIVVFSTLFLMTVIDYMKQKTRVNQIDWDVATITAADYAVEFNVNKKFYEDFKNSHKTEKALKHADESWAWYFMSWLSSEMEERLTKSTDLGFKRSMDRIKIANISMAFNNHKMIHLLRKRGTFIRQEKWDKKNNIEKQITEEMNLHYEDYIRPCSVFMTFRDEEGYQRALNYKEYLMNPDQNSAREGKGGLLDENKPFELHIKEASEPTDIIWENRQLSRLDRFKREVITVVIITLVLAGSFLLIFVVSRVQGELAQKYPIVNCDEFHQNYGQQLQDFAYADWKENQLRQAKKEKTNYAGFLNCFCDRQQDVFLAEADQLYSTSLVDGSFTEAAPICLEYRHHTFYSLFVGNLITVFILLINMLLTTVCVKLVTWISYPTHSMEIKAIVNSIFVSQFFNTGILIVLVNSNLSENFPILGKFFKGQFTDYTPLWYQKCGYYIVQTMIINMFMTPINQVIADLMSWVYHYLDKLSKKENPEKDPRYITQKKQMYTYLDLYLGPEYLAHFKYSSIFNVMYVTCLFGVGMPILFPIASLTFGIFWLHERYHVAYTYRKPPDLDFTLTENAINILKGLPLILVMNGYWMLSNLQIFSNSINLRMLESDTMPNYHTFSTLKYINQATPVLLIAVFIILIFLTFIVCPDLMHKLGFSIGKVNLVVDEELPPFAMALKDKERFFAGREFRYFERNYMLKQASDEKVRNLFRSSKTPARPIQGSPWYNIMSNFTYQSDFAYVSPGTVTNNAERNQYIFDDDSDCDNNYEQSDMVKIVLNYGFLPEVMHGKLDFQQNLHDQIKNMGKMAGLSLLHLNKSMLHCDEFKRKPKTHDVNDEHPETSEEEKNDTGTQSYQSSTPM